MMMEYELRRTAGTCRGLLCDVLGIKRGIKEN